ncbi:hypothetical protein J421_2977 [Gemmatirosa kalamazoonensis]|uniref:Uncharacterized protein n=1 Tax=Gemmatirosa kalamazoonensis TaxID=861299 RepID=W0RHB1_9BACT|nr:hypothetical protein [Gemmatirosa kalamazoonensis]AHG90514.1 hypothetical protein J421_2977 [Gemmatirosa kalamazoonensis]
MTISELVGREQRRLRARLLVAGGALGAAAIGALVAVGGLALGGARWLDLPRVVPVVLWLVVVAAGLAVAYAVRRALRRDASVGPVAAAIERERALRAGEVRGALEVARTGALGALAAEQVASRLRDPGDGRAARSLVPTLQRRAGRRAAVAGSLAAAAALALAGSLAVAGDGVAALLHPADAWRGTLLPPLRFASLPRALVRGERLRVRLEAPGRRHVRVAHRLTGRAWEVHTVAVNPQGVAMLDVGPLDADLIVTATDGRAVADTASVAVTDRAFVGDVAVRAEYPAYLGRAPETLASGEPVRVPRGTALTVSGRASTALDEVTLGAGASTVRLVPNGHTFAGRMVAETSGRWSWSARGPGGLVADVPAPLELEVVPDSAPRVEIVTPSSDSVVDGVAPVRVALAASDDHGLESVALRAWREKADGTRETPNEARLASGVPLWNGAANVDLAARAMAAGDKLHVQAVAFDASPWHQSALSRELVLRVPTTSELRAQARAAADTAVQRATAAAQAQRDLAQRTDNAARSRDASQRDQSRYQGTTAKSGGDNKAMSYEAAERAKGLAQEQRQLSSKVQQLQDQAKALERQLKQAGALDSSLASQLADVQKLLRDALTPELAQQLQSLEQNAGKLSAAQAQQSLEQLAAQQKALRQQLEKSVEMLRRAALEGSMQTLRDEAKDLASAQAKEAQRLQSPDSAQKQAPNAPNAPNGGDDAKELADRSRALQKDVDDLTKRLRNEKADVGAQKAAEATKHADASADAMERAAQQGAKSMRQEPRPEQKPGATPQRMAGSTPSASQPPQAGEQQSGAQQQLGGQQQSGPKQGGQQQGGQQQGAQQQGGQQGAASAAQQASREMQQAADQLSQARQGQIDAWKNELSSELDRAIQETMQMAREQADVEQQARSGADPSQLREQQGAVQQGVEQTAQRLDQAGRKSSLLSQRAQRALGDARQQVADATKALQQGQPGQSGAQQSASAANQMREAGESLNRAAAALVRDRERVNGAQSASGFEDMIAQMRDLAKQQGQINQQSSALQLPMPGQSGGAGREAARQLAKQQRGVADKLEDIGDNDATGHADALAKEARQLAQQLERVGADPQTAQRQQQLYRRLLDAGRTLEQDERDESGKREARSGAGINGIAPAEGTTSGRAATKFQTPEWAQLRGLSAEERRLVIEYFRRLNAGSGTPQ